MWRVRPFVYVSCLVVLVSCTRADDAILVKGNYSMRRRPPSSNLVEKIDCPAMLIRHLEGFRVQQGTQDGQRYRAELYSPEKKTKIEATIVIVASERDAEEDVLTFLNSISVVCKAGTPGGMIVGDACWHTPVRRGGAPR